MLAPETSTSKSLTTHQAISLDTGYTPGEPGAGCPRRDGYAHRMPTVTRTMTVAAQPQQIIRYLKDFAHSEEWDAGTQRGFSTELTYTLTEASQRRLVFVGANNNATSHDTIEVDPADAGSVVTYRAELTVHGAAQRGWIASNRIPKPARCGGRGSSNP